jgi:HEPN domain-containing protein
VRWDWVVLWLAKAEEDLSACDLILKGPMSSYGTVSFHAQQAIEKSLKALLVRHQVEFGKTHNLGELLRLAESIVTGIARKLAAAVELTPYAEEERYPTEQPPVSREAAGRHVAIAGTVRDAVRELLKPYLDAGRPSGQR